MFETIMHANRIPALIVIPAVEAASSRFEAPGWRFCEPSPRCGRNDDQGSHYHDGEREAGFCVPHTRLEQGN
jgi:hypothetical protein